MLKRIAFLLLSLPVLLPNTMQAEPMPTAPPAVLPVIITEIYPNAVGVGSKESNNLPSDDTPAEDIPYLNEYIEIYNTLSVPLSLANYSLFRDGASDTTYLDEITLQPHEYLVILPSFSLKNTFTSSDPQNIYISYRLSDTEEALNQYTYQSGLADTQSWSLVGDTWKSETPTPGAANPTPSASEGEELKDRENLDNEIVEDNEEINEELATCIADTVMLNEIVANPSGADSSGGEFIELYNRGDQLVRLDGCMLSTDKRPSIPLDNIVIAPSGYYTIELFNDLLNSGGTVTFVTTTQEDSVEYPELGDNESWSMLDGKWQKTKIMTPGEANKPTPQAEVTTTTDTVALAACPEGKFRNPETNRCKNIVDTASSLLPCAAGSVRNPETNRCRKITALTASSSLTPCKPGQERNPETNRCRKIASATNSLKPCEEGQERNPETNRCRKVTGVVSGATTPTDTQSVRGLHPNIMILMSVFVVAYGIYEYRLDLANARERLKSREKKTLPRFKALGSKLK